MRTVCDRTNRSPVRNAFLTGISLVVGLVASGALASCELAQVTVTEPEELVLAEIWFRVDDDRSNALALLHRTIGYASAPVDGARIRVRGTGGVVLEFVAEAVPNCSEETLPPDFEPSCYVLTGPAADAMIQPGRRLEVEVTLPGGRSLAGVTTVPGDFQLLNPVFEEGMCALPPRTLLPMAWTQAAGAWAYLPEAELVGIRNALASSGVTVTSDPAVLQGLAISQADTTVVFPSQFGIFNRFSNEERELLLAIQNGLPAGVAVNLVVTALDRNAANWVRGGAFNPSGQIRIPSLFGEGTGVVGSVVNRGGQMHTEAPGVNHPSCLSGAAPLTSTP